MRFIYIGILIAFVVVVVVFAAQNPQEGPVVFFGQTVTVSVRLLVAAVFALGTLIGGALVGLLRRSLAEVFDPDGQRAGKK